jgi:hypothetical protein
MTNTLPPGSKNPTLSNHTPAQDDQQDQMNKTTINDTVTAETISQENINNLAHVDLSNVSISRLDYLGPTTRAGKSLKDISQGVKS